MPPSLPTPRPALPADRVLRLASPERACSHLSAPATRSRYRRRERGPEPPRNPLVPFTPPENIMKPPNTYLVIAHRPRRRRRPVWLTSSCFSVGVALSTPHQANISTTPALFLEGPFPDSSERTISSDVFIFFRGDHRRRAVCAAATASCGLRRGTVCIDGRDHQASGEKRSRHRAEDGRQL